MKKPTPRLNASTRDVGALATKCRLAAECQGRTPTLHGMVALVAEEVVVGAPRLYGALPNVLLDLLARQLAQSRITAAPAVHPLHADRLVVDKENAQREDHYRHSRHEDGQAGTGEVAVRKQRHDAGSRGRNEGQLPPPLRNHEPDRAKHDQDDDCAGNPPVGVLLLAKNCTEAERQERGVEGEAGAPHVDVRLGHDHSFLEIGFRLQIQAGYQS